MSDDTTSPVTGPVTGASTDAVVLPASSALGEWRNFFGFIRKPQLPQKATGISGASLAATLRMFGLDVLVMGVLLLTVSLVSLTGFEPPRSMLADLDFGPLIIFGIVIMAPLIEEIGFRGWLSGRPGAFWSVLVLIAAFAVSLVFDPNENPLIVVTSQAGALFAAIGLAIWLRNRAPYAWFARFFTPLFWLSTLAFALVHLSNYNEDTSPVLLLFTIPQLITGAICGYVRVRYGLWSSILLHVLHNGTIMAVVLTALSAGADIG